MKLLNKIGIAKAIKQHFRMESKTINDIWLYQFDKERYEKNYQKKHKLETKENSRGNGFQRW